MLKKKYAASKLKDKQAEHSKAENSKAWPTTMEQFVGFVPAAFEFDVTIYNSFKRISLIEIKKLIFLWKSNTVRRRRESEQLGGFYF